MIPFLEISPTVISTARTFLYGGVTWLFSITPAQAIPLVDGVLVGGVLADFATWFFRSLMLLPSQIWHGIYNTAINLVFAWLIFNYFTPNLNLDVETYSIACAAFLIVAGLKTAFYSLSVIEEIFLNDGE